MHVSEFVYRSWQLCFTNAVESNKRRLITGTQLSRSFRRVKLITMILFSSDAARFDREITQGRHTRSFFVRLGIEIAGPPCNKATFHGTGPSCPCMYAFPLAPRDTNYHRGRSPMMSRDDDDYIPTQFVNLTKASQRTFRR